MRRSIVVLLYEEQRMLQIVFIDTADRMVETALVGDDLFVAANGLELKNFSDLPKIGVLVPPDQQEGQTLESVDEREEELVDEVIVVLRVEVVEVGHQLNEDLAELVLAVSADAGGLEEIQQESHSFVAVLNQNRNGTLKQIHDGNGRPLIQNFGLAARTQSQSTQQLNITQRLSHHSIGLLIFKQQSFGFLEDSLNGIVVGTVLEMLGVIGQHSSQ
jgi:hypothetical protein